MSGDSTHGAGAALCALADAASAVSATAASNVLVENLVIVHPPATAVTGEPVFEQTTNGVLPSIRRASVRDFVISRFQLRGYLPVSVSSRIAKRGHGDAKDEPIIEGLLFCRIVGFDAGAGRACGRIPAQQ